MIALLARLIFFLAVIVTVAFFTVGSQHLRIDTNLNDLNPEKIADQGLKSALDTLSRDVSHRVMIVIKGQASHAVTSASDAMKTQLDALPALSVLSDKDIQTNYLAAVSPYRFNVLSATQRQALHHKDSQQLAAEAQRKLYQLGSGIRLIPFKDDPLGWFSDYVLSRLDELSLSSAASLTNDAPADDASRAVTSFSVTFTEYPENMAQQARLYKTIQEIEAGIRAQYPVTVLHSGMFFFAVDSANSAKSDIQLIAIGSMAGVLVLMLLVFRSLLPLFLSLSSIAIGIGFGVVTSTYVFGSVHVLTIVFGASLIGIVVDYSLHYFYHFLSHQRDTSKNDAQSSPLFRAMLLSVLTSLVGYGALGLSDLLILKKVALFSCSGLVMAWLSVMVLGPLVTRRPIEARQALLRSVIDRCQSVFARQPRVLIAGGLLLASMAGLFLYAGDASTNDDPRQFFHVSASLLAQEKEVASLTQVYEPGRYLLVKGQTSDAVFETLQALYDALGEARGSLASVRDWLPSPGDQADNYALQSKIYDDDGVLDEFATRLGLSSSEFESLKVRYREARGQSLAFPALMQQLPSLPPLWIEQDGEIYSFVLIRKNSDLAKIEAASQGIGDIRYINTLANATEALKAQRETGSKLLLLAYLCIAVMLALYYRKVSTVLLLLIPLTASVITLAAVALMGQAITVFHIMALFLVLGLGMDYIIFAKEMARQRETTQQAILLSAVTSLLSFGLLAFSSMPIVQAFGSTILIGNTINFIAAISLFNQPRIEKENGPYVR